MEKFYLAVVTTGSVFSMLYCLAGLFVQKKRILFHRIVIASLLILMKISEIIFCVILDKNMTSAVIFVFLFVLILIVNVLEFVFIKKFRRNNSSR